MEGSLIYNYGVLKVFNICLLCVLSLNRVIDIYGDEKLTFVIYGYVSLVYNI